MELKDYIRGNRHGKQANRLERDAMNDPFLQEALDGYDKISGNHTDVLEQLEKKYTRPATVFKPRKKVFMYWAAAASVLLLIGTSVYLFFGKNIQNTSALSDIRLADNQSIISHDSTKSPQIEAEQPQTDAALIAQAQKEKIVVPPSEIAAMPNINIDITEDKQTDISEYRKIDKSLFTGTAADVETINEVADAKIIAQDKGLAKKDEAMQTISGKIVDETGEPMVGASVFEKGTKNGTMTDIDGNFTLRLPAGKTTNLVANFVGYQSQEISSLNTNTITLQPSYQALAEVVSTGYALSRKQTNSYSASAVAAQDSFVEKEFQKYCQQNAAKNVCSEQNAEVTVSFYIDSTGKPTNIEFKKFTCEAAKQEINRLLMSYQAWTISNRQVTLTVKFVNKE